MAILEAVFANKAGQTPQEVERRRRMAQALIESGAGGKPPSSGLELAGRLAMTLTGQYQAGKADRQDATNRASANTLLANTLLGTPATPGATGSAMPKVDAGGNIPVATAPDDVRNLIAANVPPEMVGYATNLIGKESSFNPNAVSPTGATGLAQFTRGTGKQYGLVSDQGDMRKDPVANLKALVALTNDNRTGLANALGRPPTDGELALAHQQGLQGAINLLSGKSVPGNNLAVNNVDPNMDPRAAANKIMAYYGGSGGQQGAPGEVASLDPSIGIPMPGAAGQMRANSPTQPMPQPQPQMAATQPAPALPPATNVSTPPVPPNAQQPNSMTALIPPEFQGSQQLMNADPNKGIMQALLGGTPASPEQLARAQQIGSQPQAPAAQDRRGQIAALLQNPYTQELGQQMLMEEYQRQQEASDPLRQLQLQEAQIKIDQARNPQDDYDYVKMEDGTLVRTNKRGGAPEVVFQGKPKPEAKPSAVQEYEYAKEQGFPGTFQDWEASKKGGMSLQVDPDTGAVTFQQGGNIKPMTEGQSKDAVFSTRAEGALAKLNANADALLSLPETMASGLPIGGNYLLSPEYQQAQQAGKEFLQAILRKDTGAAITKEETAEYGSVYLPRPGDTKEVLEQKKVSRQRALEAIKAGMPPQAILAQEKALTATGDVPGAGVQEPQGGSRPRATNPQTGETIEFDGTQWVPVK